MLSSDTFGSASVQRAKWRKKEDGVLEPLSSVMKKIIYISHEIVDPLDICRNREEASPSLNYPLLMHSDVLWGRG